MIYICLIALEGLVSCLFSFVISLELGKVAEVVTFPDWMDG